MSTDGHSCCREDPTPPVESRRKRGLGTWATAGSLLSAVLASACCWLPLLAVAFGASAAGAGAFFEDYRPYFLTVAAVLLGTGFYFLYLRKEDCEPGSACAVPNAKAQRVSRGMFWVSVVFIGVFAFFPNYVGYLLGASSNGTRAASAGHVEVRMEIEGMTCEGCSVTIATSLRAVDGVQSADVDYPSKSARLILSSDTLVKDPQPLLDAVKAAGYEGKVVGEPVLLGLAERTFAVDGMTCEACAVAIRAELIKVPGVADAQVVYEQKLATVQLKEGAKAADGDLLAAIKRAGYEAVQQSNRSSGGGDH